MFESLRVFEIREPIVENYVVPTLDTLGLGQSTVILPPPAPIIQTLTSTQITWENIQGVTNYILQSLSSGTVWATVATIPAPPAVQIMWNGSAWLIQIQNSGQWETLYIGPQPPVPFILVGDTPIAQTILTPNLIPTWYVPGSVTHIVGVSVGDSVPGLQVGLGSPLDPNGMTITGDPTSQVNCSLSYPGPQNGRSSYLGPDIDTYTFSPSVGTFYRMLAENAGGFSVPSNIVSLPPLPALDWTQLSWGQNGFPDVYNSGVGTSSFTPLNSLGNEFTNDCSTVDDPTNTAYSENQATVAYTGGALNCNLHLVVSGTSNAAGFRYGTLTVVSAFAGHLININFAIYAVGGMLNGTYDFPFTIPDTGGNADTITVDVTQIFTGSNPLLTGTESSITSNLDGTFSNV